MTDALVESVPVNWKTGTGDFLLDESVGWVMVLLGGVAFAIFTGILVFIDTRYGGTVINSEQFNTAGRTVKTGLTAAVIVSQWTWAATLLQSSTVAWKYGVSGPYWYAAGASIQVLLFGILAIELKIKAPKCHTMLELVRARWGYGVHKVFIVFGFLTNVIVSAMLVLGGAAVANALTGMPKIAAGFLIPIGVIPYTVAGGLKATFLASYVHTAIIFIVLMVFVFTIYGDPSSGLGDSDTVYDKLQGIIQWTPKMKCLECEDEVLEDQTPENGYHWGPVPGNRGGSYLTMMSADGLMFGVINIVGNFGTVFCDQSYWQSAIAAKPSSSHKGYLLGGLVWFTIPFALATSCGLAGVALNLNLTPDEAGQGLVPPAAASALLGEGGAVAILLMLFMAITSTGSAEQIAVSSLISYDIYRTYINPEATGNQIKFVSRCGIVFFGLFMGVLSAVLQGIQATEPALGLGWVYLFMGIVIGSAVVPIATVLTWNAPGPKTVTCALLMGFLSAVISWLATAGALNDGEISVSTTGQNVPMLVGNLFAILLSGLIVVVGGLCFPMNFDYAEFDEKISLIDDALPDLDPEDTDPETLLANRSWIIKFGFIWTGVLVVGVPLATVPWGVFPKAVFSLWCSVAVLWATGATCIIIGLPIYEAWAGIVNICRAMTGRADKSSSDVSTKADE